MKPVTFCLPLAPRTDLAKWLVLNRNLGYTLRSILRQTDPHFSVLVACQDRPICEEMHDPRVEFVPVTGPRPTHPGEYRADKRRKRQAMAGVLRERGPGYFVNHDADDIVHRRLVEHIRTTDAPHGYTYSRGYVMDMARLNIAPAETVWRGKFSNVCGSSAVFWLTPEDYDEPADGGDSYFRSFRQHAKWSANALSAGRPLQEISFPCCIYAQNNGHNISADLLRTEERVSELMQAVERNALPWTPELATDFSLDWVWSARSPRRARRPEAPIPLPAGQGAREAVLGLNAQRALLAQGFLPDSTVIADQRRALSRAVTAAAVEVIARLAPDEVYEVGAGDAAFARAVKTRLPAARVVAVEANPDLHARHAASLAEAGVEALNRCAAARAGTVTLHVPVRKGQAQPAAGSVLADPEAEEHGRHEVQAVRLDDLPSEAGSRCALSIETEGVVDPVLQGAEAVLRRCVAAFVEMDTAPTRPGQAAAGDVIARLARHGLLPVLTDLRRENRSKVLFLREDAYPLVEDAYAALAPAMRP